MLKMIKPAFLATLPVLTGYLVLGFGFGIVLKANGYGILLAFAFLQEKVTLKAVIGGGLIAAGTLIMAW